MARRPGRNDPCPCGSGKKFKVCCIGKSFQFETREAGAIVRKIPLPREAVRLLELQRERFRAKFGREPGPEAPVFFDLPPAEVMEHESTRLMQESGISPDLIYAHQKTGLIVTTENQKLIPEADLQEWDAAIAEYKRRIAAGEEDPVP